MKHSTSDGRPEKPVRSARTGLLLILLLAVTAAARSALPAQASQADGERPNLVLFFSDDHGLLDSPVYGATDVRAPAMEQLARDGLVFERAFTASPSCAPARAALLTGLMPARNGAEDNHSYARLDIETLPQHLRKRGYEVAAFGKVAHNRDAEVRGFNHVERKFDPDLIRAYLSGRDSKKPLCLMVGTAEPHVPWPDNEGYDPERVHLPPTHVDTPETRFFRACYYTDITRADQHLAAVRSLSREFLGDRSLFLYTSDHGAQWPFGKWNLYDAGIQVPMIAAWPGVIPPGRRTGAMVSWIDLLPTLVEAAGGTPPPDIDGKSMLAVLRGAPEHRSEVFTTHSGDLKMNVYPMRSIRTDRWKLILNLHPEFEYGTHIDRALDRDGVKYWRTWEAAAATDPAAAKIVAAYRERPPVELFDLRHDPYEQRNLSEDGRYAARREELRARLQAWMREQGDQQRVFHEPRLR